VRAFTRNPGGEAALRLREAGAEVVGGDFDDVASIEVALRGVGAVFLVTTPFGTDPETEVRQGVAVVDAAAGVDQVVFTSAANADRGTGIPHFDSKWRIEERLARSGVPWTVLGPAAFVDDKFGDWTLSGLRGGVLGVPMPSGAPLHLVAVADIAAVAVLALEQPARFAGVRLDLAGEVTTPAEMALALEGAIGVAIRHHQPPFEVVERYSTDLALMFRYFAEVGMDIDVPALHAALPEVSWTRYADVVGLLPWSTLL
ncbi:MAG TPA: NmrA family NAD(P)-binding protein, partial [Umezawaea sp.]|nr:NmrA family NAD(P)-binding protein [Umezawaea sp.]